jgi:glycosyltransferase involved in cell wall biosynthesis
LLLIHDVYPEVLVAVGMARRGSVIVKVMDWCVCRLYRSMERIIVLGRDMQQLVQSKLPQSHHPKIEIITNWGDVDVVRPVPREENRLLRELGLTNKFVIQYAGNLGRSHNIESILQCAERLRHKEELHFLMIGSGAKKACLERASEEKGLTNITILSHRARKEQHDFLNACDVSIITFVSGMAGVSVPSRTYNVLAAGKPIIAMADQESELARVVQEEKVGWVVEPGDVEAFSEAIVESQSQANRLREMARRARRAAVEKYRLEQIVGAYERLITPACDDQGAGEPALRRAA